MPCWSNSKARTFISFTAVVFVIGSFVNFQFELTNVTLFDNFRVDEDAEFCENILSQKRSAAKLILMASTYFTDDYYEEAEKKCSFDCLILPPKCRKFLNVLTQVDAVVVHALRADLIPALRDLKKFSGRKASKVWIFLSLETPVTLERIDGAVNWSQLNGVFNWSASYRRDSDVVIPPVQFDGFEKYQQNGSYFANRSSSRRHLAALISNCNDGSGRLQILRDLAAFGLSVDVYGGCSPHGFKCESHNLRKCLTSLNGRYFFYASFENSICRDYVTEKFYWPLDFDMVPIVLGGINYTAEAPPKSFIDVSKFSSSFELAKYLLKVASDFELYKSFLEWKSRFRIRVNPDNLPFCSICRKLYQQNKAASQEKMLDLDEWWVKGVHCQTNIFHNNWQH